MPWWWYLCCEKNPHKGLAFVFLVGQKLCFFLRLLILGDCNKRVSYIIRKKVTMKKTSWYLTLNFSESLWCVRNWWRLSSTLCLFNIVTPSSLSGFQGETTFEQSRSLTKGIFCRRFLLFLDFLRFLSLLQNFWQNSVTHVPLWVDYDKIYWG